MRQKNKIQKIENEHQKTLIKAMVRAQEIERSKIAKNIHDDIATKLQVAKLQVSGLKQPESTTSEQPIIESINNLLGETITIIRQISQGLRPPVLDKLGLVNAIEEYLEAIKTSENVWAEGEIDDTIIISNKEDEAQLYRILVELGANTIKYANPTNIQIKMYKHNSSVVVELQHNGKGINHEEAVKNSISKNSLGLSSVFSRALASNSTVIFSNEKNKITITYYG